MKYRIIENNESSKDRDDELVKSKIHNSNINLFFLRLKNKTDKNLIVYEKTNI